MYTIEHYLRGEVPLGAKLLCPFHPDHHPSAQVMRDTRRFWCFACQWGGGPVEVARRLYFADLPYALGQLMAEFWCWKRPALHPAMHQAGQAPRQPRAPVERDPEVMTVMTAWCELAHAKLMADKPLQARLRDERGITHPGLVKIGVAGADIFYQLRNIASRVIEHWPARQRELLERAGLVDPEGRYRLGSRYILPAWDGNLVLGYQARHQQADYPVRYLNPKGWPKAVAGLPSLVHPGPIWIVEGWFDAAPLWQQGLAALALGGLSLGEAFFREYHQRLAGRELVVILDNDLKPAAREATRKALERIKKLAAHYQIVAHAFHLAGPFKDLSAWAAADGADRVVAELLAIYDRLDTMASSVDTRFGCS